MGPPGGVSVLWILFTKFRFFLIDGFPKAIFCHWGQKYWIIFCLSQSVLARAATSQSSLNSRNSWNQTMFFQLLDTRWPSSAKLLAHDGRDQEEDAVAEDGDGECDGASRSARRWVQGRHQPCGKDGGVGGCSIYHMLNTKKTKTKTKWDKEPTSLTLSSGLPPAWLKRGRSRWVSFHILNTINTKTRDKYIDKDKGSSHQPGWEDWGVGGCYCL